MKKNKKSLLILLILTFIFLIPKIYADDDTYSVKITADNTNTEINDEIIVTIDLKTSTDTACTLGIKYDTSKLSIERATGVESYDKTSISVKNSSNSSSKLYFRALTGGNSEISVDSVTCNDTNLKGSKATVNINTKSPDLSGINISNGTLSPEFSSNITDYTAILTAQTTTISATATNQDSKITGNGDYSLNIGETKEVKIVVTTQGGTQKTYKIKLTRPADANKSNNNNLEYISFNGKKIDFNKENVIYTLTVKNTIENADIKYKVEDEKATATLSGPEKLNVGENTYKITVTAEDGSTKEYTLIITRQKEKNTVDYNEEAILNEIENGKEENIYVTVKQTEKIKTIDKSIIKKLKQTGKNIIYEITNNDNELLYSIILKGKNIKSTSKMLNFNMTFKSNYKTLIDKLTNNKDIIYLNFDNNTELPGKISVKVFVSNKFKNGKKLYLYYYNDKTNKLEKEAKNLTVKNGYIEFELEHTSEYILSDTDFDSKVTPTKDNKVYIGIISAIAGLLSMIIFMIVYIIIRKKKKNKDSDEPKKEKKKKRKSKNTEETPLEETNLMEDNVELEKTIQIDMPNSDIQEQILSNEQPKTPEISAVETEKQEDNNIVITNTLEKDNDKNSNNEQNVNNETVEKKEETPNLNETHEEIEILDLDDTNQKNNM